jgi:GTP-binding protein
VAIGGADAVVFDFAPQVDVGAEILSRRGEDQRFTEERPAARRRREKDAAYHAEDDDELGSRPDLVEPAWTGSSDGGFDDDDE